MAQVPEPTPRRTSWVTLLYYYLAALTGLVIVITGAIIAVNAGVDAIFYEEPPPETATDFDTFDYEYLDDRRDNLEDALKGILTAGVGFPIFLWHIRAARRKEDETPTA